jgi:hypothetical protein
MNGPIRTEYFFISGSSLLGFSFSNFPIILSDSKRVNPLSSVSSCEVNKSPGLDDLMFLVLMLTF